MLDDDKRTCGGGLRRLRIDDEVYRLTRSVAQWYRVPMIQVIGRTKTSRAVKARQVSIYLAHTLLSRPHDDLADIFGRHAGTISRACHRIEDQRDEPQFDARIACLEEGWEMEAAQ